MVALLIVKIKIVHEYLLNYLLSAINFMLAQMWYSPFYPLWVQRKTNRRPCCPPMSNPSTSPWTSWPDGSGRWDNRKAAQHLPRDRCCQVGVKQLAQTKTSCVPQFDRGSFGGVMAAPKQSSKPQNLNMKHWTSMQFLTFSAMSSPGVYWDGNGVPSPFCSSNVT